jgi:hypothetical protein
MPVFGVAEVVPASLCGNWCAQSHKRADPVPEREMITLRSVALRLLDLRTCSPRVFPGDFTESHWFSEETSTNTPLRSRNLA